MNGALNAADAGWKSQGTQLKPAMGDDTMATDPVCGMYVDEKSSALDTEREGRKYYFCSTSCKLQFEKPERELRSLRTALMVSWPPYYLGLGTYLYPAPGFWKLYNAYSSKRGAVLRRAEVLCRHS